MSISDPTPGRAATSSPRFDVLVERDVQVPARDGTRLATDVFRPARDGVALPGRWPVILHRTPYDKEAVERRWGYAEWFARRGYVAVMQDVRGTYGSQGECAFALPDAEDGADTLAWLAEQEWAGPVGSWGTSYSSFTQLASATQGPANLRAMVPNQSAFDAWHSGIRQGGAAELRFLGWALWHSAANPRAVPEDAPWARAALNLGAPSTSDWLRRLPVREGVTQLRLTPSYERWLLRFLTESDYTDFWRQPGLAPGRYVDRFPDADVLLMGAWYDSYPRATLEAYQALAARGRGLVRVLMGPWVHGTAAPQSTLAGDVDFGAEAAVPNLRELHLRWFDHALKGEDTGLADEPPVRIFVMGGGGGHRTAAGRLFHGGRWRDESGWPLARTVFTPYHLHVDGGLRVEPPTAPTSSTSYRFDPADPVPSIGGSVSSQSDLLPMPPLTADPDVAGGATRYRDLLVAGGFDQVEAPGIFGCRPPYLPLAARRDVLVFRTEPLAADVEVTGPVEVRLWVSTSAVDTDFTAKLIDEYPPSRWYPMGYALNLTDGIQRLRYRDGGTADLLPPQTRVEITVVLYPTSNLFAAGHRIRLDVSSSNFPRFDVNPNTGEPLGRERGSLVAVNTVHHDAGRPSRVILPVIPGPDVPGRGHGTAAVAAGQPL